VAIRITDPDTDRGTGKMCLGRRVVPVDWLIDWLMDRWIIIITSDQSNLPPHMDSSIVFARLCQCAPIWHMLPWTHPSPYAKWHLHWRKCCSVASFITLSVHLCLQHVCRDTTRVRQRQPILVEHLNCHVAGGSTGGEVWYVYDWPVWLLRMWFLSDAKLS